MKYKTGKTLINAGLIIILAVIMGSSLFWIAAPADAQVFTDWDINLGTADPLSIVVAIINWGLGILALIAVIVILIGGFVWMTSNGDEEKIKKAKLILRNGVIGLVIILAAWGIAAYIINILLDATGFGQGGPGQGGGPGGSGDVVGAMSVRQVSPLPDPAEFGEVDLCRVISVTFTLPLVEESVTAPAQDFPDEFKNVRVFIPEYLDQQGDTVDAGEDGETCADNFQCRSGVCDNGNCVGNQMVGSIQLFESSYGFSFYHDDFLADTTYKVELGYGEGSGIEGNDGQISGFLSAADDLRQWYFTTGNETDEIPPQVDINYVYPNDGNTDVCQLAPVQVIFNETMDPASIRSDNIWLNLFADGVANVLDVNPPNFISFQNPYDTFVSGSPNILDPFTKFTYSLYSGDAANDFEGAMRDACGNPLDGNYNGIAEGNTTDDFVDPASAKLADGWEYPWDFTTNDDPLCEPLITDLNPDQGYYSEDLNADGQADLGDSYVVDINGENLIGALWVNFTSRIDAANFNCFDNSQGMDHYPYGACLVSMNNTLYQARTPSGSQTGPVNIATDVGEAQSPESYTVLSPYISRLSPNTGPPGQFITVKGSNFGQNVGQVFLNNSQQPFNRITAELPCANSWRNTEIIIKVPEDIALSDYNLQVVTEGGNYSNYQILELYDGLPGPGICELREVVSGQACSDTGQNPIDIFGENYGDSTGQIFFEETEQEQISLWNAPAPNPADGAYVEVPNSPETDQGRYDVKAASADANLPLSNGLDFEMPCNPAPELFYYRSCNVDEGVLPLPNPYPSADNGCKNALVSFAFTADMNYNSVNSAFSIYKCNNGEDYDGNTCEQNEVPGTLSEAGFLPGAYIGQVNDTDYEKFKFVPAQGADLEPGYWYNITVTTNAAGMDSVPVPQDYNWQFRVREGDQACVADHTVLYPYRKVINFHNPANPCSDGENDYTFNGSAYNEDCIELNIGTWHWYLQNQIGHENQTVGDILQFQSNEIDKYKSGQNADQVTVCTQGDDENNFGYTDLFGEPWDTDNNQAMSSDDSEVIVDFGYCTDDTDCQSNPGCGDSVCNLQTSHCEPTINDVNPNPVGQNSCITVSGCYFGASREGTAYCECTVDDNTCFVYEGSASCILPGLESCYLDPNPEKADPNDANNYVPGYVLDVCNNENPEDPDDPNDATYTIPGLGALKIGNDEVGYLADQPQCGDIWSDSQIVGQVLNTTAGAYPVSITSYYGFEYIYGTDLNVGAFQAPCLCRVEPDQAYEGATVDLYGKDFGTTSGSTSFYALPTRESGAFDAVNWTDTQITDVIVPARAISGYASEGNEGVYVTDANGARSNAKDFGVSCSNNWDCSTQCCFNNQCAEENVCNACVDKTDCVEAGGCGGECTNGTCDPVISSLSPGSGAVGQPVTVQGCHFGTPGPQSNVTFGDTVAEYICSSTSWNNHEIYVRAPNDSFVEGDEASVTVNRRGVDEQNIPVTLSSNAVNFVKNSACEGILFPELCNMNPGYAPFGASTDAEGFNLTDSSSGFCECENEDPAETCLVTEGANSCNGQTTTTLYAYSENTAQECTEDMDSYDTNANKCIVALENDPNTTCEIELGQISCDIIQNFTCELDDINEDGNPDTCNTTYPDYTLQGGAAVFYNNKTSGVWDLKDIWERYETEVPGIYDEPESGDVAVEASIDQLTCTSNGIEFPITCDDGCGDCADGQNCFNDSGLQMCTFEDAGFCRQDPGACCGNTGCEYEDTPDPTADLGTCTNRPTLAGSTITNGATNVCPNAAIRVQFSEQIDNVDTSNIILKKNNVNQNITVESQTGFIVDVIQEGLLTSGTYALWIKSDAGNYPNNGLVSRATGLAPDCHYSFTGDCAEYNRYIKIEFTVAQDACDPDYVDLNAADIEWADGLGYIMNEPEQEEDFVATVYDEGDPNDADDDQALREMEGGEPGDISWDYSWYPKYETMEDMANAQCGYSGILMGGPEADFNQDVDTHTVTADNPTEDLQPDQTRTEIGVTVEGLGETEHGWTGSLSDSKMTTILYCPEDNLAVYNNNAYRFTLLYCRGQEGEDLLPDFFGENNNNVTHLVGSNTGQDYLDEYLFSNDDNEDLLGMRIYANDVAGNGNFSDSVKPGLWYTERAQNPNSNYGTTSVNGYEAATVGTTTYIGGSTIINNILGYPNIFLLSYNQGAQNETTTVVNEILDKILINNRIGYVLNNGTCTDNPNRVARDTKRLNDLGTIKFYLDNYRDSDLNADGVANYPKVNTGSYVKNMSTSAWPSWTANLGNALGTSLPSDPLNTFTDCGEGYDPATCWDALNKKFYGPAGSYIYLYKSNSAGTPYYLYADMEYSNSPWDNGSYNPCSSPDECSTFNYEVSEN
ncbi:Ig-like domain-containing protein [Patescibacteria group bacterium]|nr:Ig-like domain-containing protein [Patescibacteria group bacterium]